jgi:hypothetical protein
MPTSELCRVVERTIAGGQGHKRKIGIILRHKQEVSLKLCEPGDG